MTLRYLTRTAERAVVRELRRIEPRLLLGHRPRTVEEWTRQYGQPERIRMGEPGPITIWPRGSGDMPRGFQEEA